MKQFPIKQVHLDFHTSPDIPGIGSRFDKKQFQAALKAGHLDSITVFAKCHHGYCYYPTKVGTMHPGLDFDLTGAMVDAAHEIGVRAPIYITGGWCALDAEQHPEWRTIKKDGNVFCTGSKKDARDLPKGSPMRDCAWDHLCLNDGTYCQHIYELTEEVCQRYPVVDGLFYDICAVGEACYCPECQAGMRAMGLDPEKEADARKYFVLKRQAFMEKCGQIMRKYHPDATIFFNSGGANPAKTDYHAYQTHYEMEDLPTAWGGYDKMPFRAKFFARTGKPYMGMTGKFHLVWGEFGGFKSKEAMKYEVCAMALFGAAASIGDHMHPDGEMEMQTYENVGYAYEYLEKIQPYCYGGEPVAPIGVVTSANADTNTGISCILLENQIDYGIVFDNDFARFDTVIVPEEAKLDDIGIEALKAYIAQGGKVLHFADALVRDGKFAIDTGAAYVGAAEYDCDYLSYQMETPQELPNAPMLCVTPSHYVELTDGQVLGQVCYPYFNRTNDRYCGHKNTPHDKNGPTRPGIVKKGNVVYMAHPMASIYARYGSLFLKRYVMAALEQLAPKRPFRVTGLQSVGRATMIRQADQNRYCLNLLYGSPLRRGCAEIIEDILPVYNIGITLDIPETIRLAYEPITGEELPIRWEDGRQVLTLPKLECHSSVVLEY